MSDTTHDEQIQILRRSIHQWIAESSPLAVKMSLSFYIVEKLVNAIYNAIVEMGRTDRAAGYDAALADLEERLRERLRGEIHQSYTQAEWRFVAETERISILRIVIDMERQS